MNAVLELIPGGRFVARPATVGADDDEIAAMEKGMLPKERADAIGSNLRNAAFMLNSTPCAGYC